MKFGVGQIQFKKIEFANNKVASAVCSRRTTGTNASTARTQFLRVFTINNSGVCTSHRKFNHHSAR